MILRPELLLHPPIPLPMHGIAPRVIFGKEWWDREQLLTKKHANWRCQVCGIHKSKARYHKWVEAHECYQIDYVNGIMYYVETVSLCHSCHSFIHRNRLQALQRKGLISKTKCKSIISRGFSILRENKLILPPTPKIIAPWDKWRLVVNGIAYKGISKSEWNKRYG